MTPSAAARLAYVGTDRQLHVVRADGSGQHQVSYPGVGSALLMWGGSKGGDACAWPTWSPDGRWLACFRSTQGSGEEPRVQVSAVEVEGVQERLLEEIASGLPLYARWSPDGAALGVLVQRQEALDLRVCELNEVGRHRLVDEGPPLFFSWMPDSSRVLVHAGGASGKRLVLRDARGNGEDIPLLDAPGGFCTPMLAGERVLVAEETGEGSTVVSLEMDGTSPEALVTRPGLLAFVPDPTGRWLAFTHVHESRGPYDGLEVLALDGSSGPRRVKNSPCLAFAWLPDGKGLLTVDVDEPAKRLWWTLHGVESGESRRLAPFRPTREMMFHLHFFEQFVHSHPLVSPDGRYLVYATYEHADGDPDAPNGTPHITVLDLHDPDAAPVAIAAGRYAVFAPGDA